MGQLSKSTIIQETFKTIWDRLNSDVTEVTLTDSSTVQVQTYTGSFPDKDIDTSSKYPILVINSPDIRWDELTFTKKQADGTFVVDIYTTKAESTDLFIDAIINSLETYRDTLRSYGMTNVNLDNTDYDSVMRGKIKIHRKSCTFGFKYIFNKTRTW